MNALRIHVENNTGEKIPLVAQFVVKALVFKVCSLVREPGVLSKSGSHSSAAQAQRLLGLNF